MITLQERVHSSPKPARWNLNKLHRVFRVRKGFKNNGMQEDNLLSLSYGRIIRKSIDAAEGLLPESFETYQIVEPGNIVMRLTDLQNDKRSLRQGLVKERGIITSAYDALELEKGHDPRFWAYALLALDLAKYYYSLGGGVRQSIKFSDFPNDWISAPTAHNQRAIADFLDRETARIDQLIERKQHQSKLNDERLKAFIQETIDGAEANLNQPLHRFCKIVTGKTPSRADEGNFDSDEGLPWATPANLGFFKPIVETKEKLTDSGSIGQLSVPSGTVLINGIGASIGKVGFAGCELAFNQQIHGIIQISRLLDDQFLFFVMLTKKDEIVALASNTTIPIINAERFGRISVPLPHKEVQAKAVQRIELQVRYTGMLTEALSRSVELLLEFRSALITAAVTGQIDVANWDKHGQNDRHLDEIQEAMRA